MGSIPVGATENKKSWFKATPLNANFFFVLGYHFSPLL